MRNFLIHICIFLILPAIAVAKEAGPSQEVAVSSTKKLDLVTAQKMALEGNPTLAAAASRVRQASARLRQTRSQYFPRLDFSASVNDKRLSDNAHASSLASAQLLNPQATVDLAEEYYSADLTFSFTLFDGFERRFAHAAAKYNFQGSEEALRDSHRLLLSAVATGFYNAILGWEKIKISKADETYNKRLLHEAQTRRKVGTGSLSDELNFKIKVQSALSDLLQAENNYAIAMSGLAALLGKETPFSSDLTLVGFGQQEEQSEVSPISVLQQYAQNHRPDILQAQKSREEANATVNKAKANFYPSVNLSAAMTGERTGSGRIKDNDIGSSVSATLSYNIFAGDQHRAKLHEAEAAHDEAKKKLDDLLIAVNDQVRQARVRLIFANKQLDLQKATAELVKQNRNLVEKEYAVGQASLTRLNEAQRDMIQTESRLAQSIVAVLLARQDLKAVTGHNLEEFMKK